MVKICNIEVKSNGNHNYNRISFFLYISLRVVQNAKCVMQNAKLRNCVSQFRLYAFALKNHQRDTKNTRFLTCRILRRFLGRFLVYIAQNPMRFTFDFWKGTLLTLTLL